jgi:hypothetical protein
MVTVGEGGQAEAIVPLSQMRSMMRLPKQEVASSQTVNIVVNAGMGADGQAIGKQLVAILKKYERTNGAVWKSA